MTFGMPEPDFAALSPDFASPPQPEARTTAAIAPIARRIFIFLFIILIISIFYTYVIEQ